MVSAEHLQRLLDEREIRRCILRYCHGTDRFDWQLVVDCYVPGALDDHGSFNGPVEKLADWLADKSRHRGAKIFNVSVYKRSGECVVLVYAQVAAASALEVGTGRTVRGPNDRGLVISHPTVPGRVPSSRGRALAVAATGSTHFPVCTNETADQ